MTRPLLLPVLALLLFCRAADAYTLPTDVANDIRAQQAAVSRIVSAASAAPFKGTTYRSLATLCDTIGHRLLGSEALETSIDWLVAQATADNLTV